MSKAGTKLIKSAHRTLAYARGEVHKGFVVHDPSIVIASDRRERGNPAAPRLRRTRVII